MPILTDKEADALDELLTRTLPETNPEVQGPFIRHRDTMVIVDTFSAEYLKARTLATKQTPAELIVCEGYIPRPLGRLKGYVPRDKYLTKTTYPAACGGVVDSPYDPSGNGACRRVIFKNGRPRGPVNIGIVTTGTG